MSPIRPGLLILQGNRLELLREAVFEWIAANPLAPLEEEVFLVQSNGIAEWLKMALAANRGICAATRVELPARFLWRSYRQVLGADAVPHRSPLDKTALTWRLLQLLPAQLAHPAFGPLQRFLAAGDWERRLQLVQRLADLFDQYQVYRADWLAAWAVGDDRLPGRSDAAALPDDQRWQPLLWRALLRSVGDEAASAARPALQRRFVDALAAAAPMRPVARRVVLFGMSAVPQQTLEALTALSRHAQVLLAVPNPCRFHWADIIEGREMLSGSRRRLAYRSGRDLSTLSLEDMHAHAHPLLAAWGRQGRDFVRQLDQHEDALSFSGRSAPSVELFDTTPGDTLLAQVQACVRDLVPLRETTRVVAAQARDAGSAGTADRSIVFHVAHSPQREVEVLHDRLLALLADPPSGPLAPRDIVVMMPNVESFAPAIRAVFGQYTRHDARYIPFNLVDLQQRSANPLVRALDWLLRLPHHRCGSSELEGLLEVPALAARFGIAPDELPLLRRWMAGAGIRWGLHAGQRAALGLAACGEQNTWLFGLQRMLLGFASGADADFADIEAYDEVGGLEAALVGSLAALVDAVIRWNEQATLPATAPVWGARMNDLLAQFFAPTDDAERAALGQLLEAQRDWLEASTAAGFEEAIPLAVVREAWLSGVDAPSLGQRFVSGGVTFCTLLPMRAVPFEVVCLLGMNDGDYPRQTPRSDFDLMGLPGQRRPGDRSRRDDDRYLMLEALLSARQVLYVSWSGRSVRDNSVQPPSILVAQLRDYLAAGWGTGKLDALTTEHPLQPFSRRYFEPDSPLTTYAREWRDAHREPLAVEDDRSAPPAGAAPPIDMPSAPEAPHTLVQLARFLQNPVKAYFRLRLQVVFDELPDPVEDDERFGLTGLEDWKLVDGLLRHASAADEPASMLQPLARRLVRAGRLPIAELGRRACDDLVAVTAPMLQRWQALCADHPRAIGPRLLQCRTTAGALDDWLDGLRGPADAGAAEALRLAMSASRLGGEAEGKARPDKLIHAWVHAMAATVCGQPVATALVGRDVLVELPAPTPEVAQPAWEALLEAWQAGMRAPLPVPGKTALAYLENPENARKAYEGGSDDARGEGDDACLARTFPDLAALQADGQFAHWAPRLFEPLRQWVESARVTAHALQTDASPEPSPCLSAWTP